MMMKVVVDALKAMVTFISNNSGTRNLAYAKAHATAGAALVKRFRLALRSPHAKHTFLWGPRICGARTALAPIAASVTSKNLGLRARTSTDFFVL